MILRAALFATLLAFPAQPGTAQDATSTREAFLSAARANAAADMKRLMAPTLTMMRGGELSADQFLATIEGCPLSFAGARLVSWRCEGSDPHVVTVVLLDGPERVTLSDLASMRVGRRPDLPSAPTKGEDR